MNNPFANMTRSLTSSQSHPTEPLVFVRPKAERPSICTKVLHTNVALFTYDEGSALLSAAVEAHHGFNSDAKTSKRVVVVVKDVRIGKCAVFACTADARRFLGIKNDSDMAYRLNYEYQASKYHTFAVSRQSGEPIEFQPPHPVHHRQGPGSFYSTSVTNS